MSVFKVICIDSSNKPKKISPFEWIEEGITYTVIEVASMNLQNNKLGFKLKEVQLSEHSFPYEYYNAERFIPIDTLIHVGQEEVFEKAPADLELV
jgi:hypothetical protein